MATTIDKLKDLDYDEIVALAVIEKDEDLNEIFTDEVKMSYNMLRALSKEGKLSESNASSSSSLNVHDSTANETNAPGID
jgi:hypothetical protein